MLKLPCAVGDKIYEIIEDDIPVYEVYIKEYEVQDISTKEVKYCDDWILIDYENLYFCYEDAVKKLAAMHGRTDNDGRIPHPAHGTRIPDELFDSATVVRTGQRCAGVAVRKTI